MSGLTFHHFGLAVRQPRDASTFLNGLGYHLGEPFFEPNQNVNLILGTHASQPIVEVIYPATGTSPIDQLIHQHTNGIIYHLCYITENLEQSLAQLEEAGLRPLCVSEPQPAPFFPGYRASFYNVIGMGLIEILSSDAEFSRP